MSLNNDQKRALAAVLLNKAGDIVEFFTELCPELAEEIDAADAAAQLAVWLKNLPGDAWDVRLPDLP